MGNIRPLKANAASRDGTGMVTATPDKLKEFENGDAVPLALGGTGANTASDALTNLGVSTFMKTVLDDVDAATARATLEVSAGGGMFTGGNITKNANYTVVNTDANKFILVTAANVTITIPNLATSFNDGDVIGIGSIGTGTKVVSSTAGLCSYIVGHTNSTPLAECLILRAVDDAGTKRWAVVSEPGLPLYYTLTTTNGTRSLIYDVRTWFGTQEGADQANARFPVLCNKEININIPFIGGTTENFVVSIPEHNANASGSRMSGKEINIYVERDGTAGTKTIDFTHATNSTYIRKSFTGPQAIAINERWVFTVKELGSYIYINALRY